MGSLAVRGERMKVDGAMGEPAQVIERPREYQSAGASMVLLAFIAPPPTLSPR